MSISSFLHFVTSICFAFYSAASIRKFVALDASAANALHLFPAKMQSTNKYGSIFGIMEAGCRTVMGKRVLNRWLRQPLTDIDAIRGRQSIVKAFVDDVSMFYDVELELKQLARNIANLAQVLHTHRTKVVTAVSSPLTLALTLALALAQS